MVLSQEILDRFQASWSRHLASGVVEPTALTLATADALGRPSSRVVLLKEWSAEGFTIFTNLQSRKGVEIAENPWAALSFFWPLLGEQVRVEGRVERVSDADSDAYWVTRARESQIGAWASTQSRPLRDMDELRARFDAFSERYADQPVPRPPHWGGIRVVPHRVEFWRLGDHRLHTRHVYEASASGWSVGMLFP